jgi:glycosyltransferase involved in cell wall biosynthesis
MRIALTDNMNNNFFALVRYLRDLGHDAELFLIPQSSHKHFLPEKDTYTDLSNASWLKSFPVTYKWSDSFKSKKRIRNTFKDYDLIISCGYSTGLLYSAGIKTDIFIPYGSDLIHLPFISSEFINDSFSPKKLLKSPYSLYKSLIQKKGIQASSLIISNSNWLYAERALNKMGRQSLNLPRVMVYPEEPIEGDLEWKFLDGHDFTVFSPTRHLWKTNSEPVPDFEIYGGAKRNDKLIRAFKKLIELNIYSNPLLILSDFGADVQYSKDLISELEIENFVKWLPLLPRRSLVQGMSKVTFVADQFRKGMSATSAGTTNEALAMGVPVITNTDNAILDPGDPYYGSPILEALEEEEILNYFTQYDENKTHFHEVGRQGKKWFSENLGIGLVKKYLRHFE